MEKGELNDYEIKLKTKTSFKFASVNARLIYDGENKPHHIDGSIRDISERKKNEEELRQKNDELIKLNSEKDKFFSIIAHDLRSPFNSFLGFTELLADEPQISNGEIKKIASHQGILSMRQDGIVKVLNGITSMEEVQSVVDLLEE